jgi:hypothetical protein
LAYPPRFMLRQDHGAEQVKLDILPLVNEGFSTGSNFREGAVECGGSQELYKQGKSERQSSMQVGGFEGVGDGEFSQSRTGAEHR